MRVSSFRVGASSILAASPLYYSALCSLTFVIARAIRIKSAAPVDSALEDSPVVAAEDPRSPEAVAARLESCVRTLKKWRYDESQHMKFHELHLHTGRDRTFVNFMLPPSEDSNGAFWEASIRGFCRALEVLQDVYNMELIVLPAAEIAEALVREQKQYDVITLSYHGNQTNGCVGNADDKLAQHRLMFNLARSIVEGGRIILDACFGALFANNAQKFLTEKRRRSSRKDIWRQPIDIPVQQSDKTFAAAPYEATAQVWGSRRETMFSPLRFIAVGRKEDGEQQVYLRHPQRMNSTFNETALADWQWVHIPKLPDYLDFQTWWSGTASSSFGLPRRKIHVRRVFQAPLESK